MKIFVALAIVLCGTGLAELGTGLALGNTVLIVLGAASLLVAPLLLRQLHTTVRSAEIPKLGPNALPGTAVIRSVSDTNLTIHDDPMAELCLLVTIDGHPTYEATVRSVVPRLAVARLVPGSRVAVRADMDARTTVHVDWDRAVPDPADDTP